MKLFVSMPLTSISIHSKKLGHWEKMRKIYHIIALGAKDTQINIKAIMNVISLKQNLKIHFYRQLK